MADIEDFTINNPEIEIHNLVDEETNNTPLPDLPKTPGHSTSDSDNDSEEDIEAIKTELQKEIEQLKEQLSEEKKSKAASRKRTRKPCNPQTTTVMPPPPPVGNPSQDDGTGPSGDRKNRTSSRTVMNLLHHLTTMVTIRMDDYAIAYTMFQDLQESKAPQTAVKLIAEIMTTWSQGLTVRLGNSSCIEYLMQSLNHTLSTKSLASTTWAHLLRFFQNCGTPGGSVPKTTEGSSLSASITTMTVPTTTSSMTARGTITHAGAAGSQDSGPGPKRARRVDPSMYVQKVFEDLQSTSAREGDVIYTSKSTAPIGGTVVKLEVYNFEDIESLPRMQWWSYAQFRGTIMTTQPQTMEAAVRLQDLMETEIENRPGTRFIKSSL